MTATSDADNTVLFGGTATTLIRRSGFALLTDPNFLRRGQRAYLGHGLWSKRRTDPAIGPDTLPELDAVVLSHLHGDHFDRIARRALPASVPIITTRHAARRLGRRGFIAADGLATWASRRFQRGDSGLTITAMPGQHARGAARALRLPPVMGSVLEFTEPGQAPYRIYISGDTLCYDELRSVGERFPALDLALLHLGGTRIAGLLVTMDGRQGVDLLDLVRPRHAVPIHNDDYGVFRSPRADFEREVARRQPDTTVRLLERGELYRLEPSKAG
jgi:L-ascorbate metabolism protein UlaG (beta-lactamase superfamily)